MSRTIGLLALLQLLLVVIGFTALGIILKMNGYPDNPTVRWQPIAVTLRHYGPWLLLLPVAWVVFASVAQERERGVFSSRVALLLALAISASITVLFFYAIIFPYTRPLLFFHP